MGYVYKRPSKITPCHAPGKEKKQETVKENGARSFKNNWPERECDLRSR